MKRKWCLLLSILFLMGCTVVGNDVQSTAVPLEEPAPTSEPTSIAVGDDTKVESTTVPEEPAPTLEPEPTMAVNEHVQTADYEGVIFHKDNAEAQNSLVGFSTDFDNYYTPTAAEIASLETNLQSFLEEFVPEIAARYSEYQRQYIGFERAGKTYVLINAFCSSNEMDWQNNILFVSDGGSCYFNVEYDISGASFSRLYINGES